MVVVFVMCDICVIFLYAVYFYRASAQRNIDLGILSVCLSVRPFITLLYCIETT